MVFYLTVTFAARSSVDRVRYQSNVNFSVSRTMQMLEPKSENGIQKKLEIALQQPAT